MKKLLLSILLIHFIVLAPFHSDSPPSLESPSPITLNLWVQDSNKQVEIYFNQAIHRFSSQYPHIKIDLKMLKGDDLKTSYSISTARLNQDIPDLIASSLSIYNQLTTEHFLYPLDDFIATYPRNHFLETAIASGNYNNTSYGIAYALNPEILVYRKDFLDSINIPYPENINTLPNLKEYVKTIDALYQTDRLDKIAFAIPTLTANGNFIASLLHTIKVPASLDDTLKVLSSMYYEFDSSPYHYSKIETHPFFSGKAALSIEPLSLVYAAIEKDNNLLKKIGIMPLPETGLQFAYSQHKYLSICNDTSYSKEALLFLDFFFSSQEVLNRYKTLNLPVVLESLMPIFIQDSRFDNRSIYEYVQASFHFNISQTLEELLSSLDVYYDNQLHRNK